MEEETIYDIIERTGGYPVHGVHRGGGGNFGPESTLYSFEKCLLYGARLLELDIRLTKDRELVIMHDYCVERTTDGKGPLNEYTLEEVKRLDAAFRYPELRGKGVRVPTLREFLEKFVPVPDLLFFFDFKDKKPIRLALEMIRTYKIENRFILGSVFPECNKLLRKLRPSDTIPVVTDKATTIDLVLSNPLLGIRNKRVKQDIFGYVYLPPTERFFTASLVEELHKKGLKVLICGENLSSEKYLKLCCELGIEFIITDRPDLFQKVLLQLLADQK